MYKDSALVRPIPEKLKPKGRDLLFNQEDSDKELLQNKRIRKMFFESFKEEFKETCAKLIFVFVPTEKETIAWKKVEDWYELKLKESE